MKKTNIIYGLGILALLALGACKRTLPAPGQTMTPNVAGNWWVTLRQGNTTLSPYFFVTTYNTAANTTDSIWVDDPLLGLNGDLDNGNLIYYTYGISYASFKVKAALQYTALTFSGANLQNQDWTGDTSSSETLSIYNGKVFPKGTTAKGTGVTTDSIYFQVVYSKNPLDTFVVSGYERTGQIDDDN
jgi:hypothetical protein